MGVALPHIADRDAVIAQDATQNAYTVAVDVVTGRRYAIGFVLLVADTGKSFVVKVNGDVVASRGTNVNNLANLQSDWFEDGVIWGATTTGEVEITVETLTPDAVALDGVIIREPSERSGVVEDQGSGTHCYPISCMYDGQRYQMHAEMYTGGAYLSIDSNPQGQIFPPIPADYNERYHNGLFVTPVSGGVVVGRAGHNQPNLDLRYLPGGAIGSATAVVNVAEEGARISYCRTVTLSDDTVVIFIRGSLSGGTNAQGRTTAVSIVDPHLLGSGGHTVIEDVAITGGTNVFLYPVHVELLDGGDAGEVVIALVQDRDNGNPPRWARTFAIAYAPHVGDVGRWYSILGHDAANKDVLGTATAPRFSSTQRTTVTVNGNGIIALGIGLPSVHNRYSLQSGFYRITQWPDADTPVVADISFPFVDGLGATAEEYGTVTYKWCMIVGGVRTTAPEDFSLPEELTGNSYRQFGVCFQDSEGIKRFIVTDRGTRLHETLYGETTEVYYDWGTANRISSYVVSNEFSNFIAFTPEGTLELGSELTAGWMTRVFGTDLVIYETAVNELHPTHRQSNTAASFGDLEPPPIPPPDPVPTAAAYYVHVGGVTPKVVAWTWVQNSVAVTTTGATIDIQSIDGTSLIGGPQPAIINPDARQHRYEHGSSVMTRNNVYWLIFSATINGESLTRVIPYRV